MKKDVGKQDKSSPVAKKKTVKNGSSPDRKPVPKTRSDEKLETKPVQTNSSGIKITIRTNGISGKAQQNSVEKTKAQEPLFENQAVQGKKAGDSAVSKQPDSVQSVSASTKLPREKINNTLKKISALSQTLHEENQINLNRTSKIEPVPVVDKPLPANEPVLKTPVKDNQEQDQTISTVQNEKGDQSLRAELPKKETEPIVPLNKKLLEKTPAPSAVEKQQSDPIAAQADMGKSPQPEAKPTPQQEVQPVSEPQRVNLTQPTASPVNKPIPSAQSEKPSAGQPVVAQKASPSQERKKSDAAASAAPMQKPVMPEKVSQPQPDENTLLKKKLKRQKWIVGIVFVISFLAGAGFGGWQTYRWYDANNAYKKEIVELKKQLMAAERTEQKLTLQLDDTFLKLNNLQLGMNQINKIFAESGAAPDKPHYIKTKQGIVVYWIDGMMWRRYHLYQARGKNGRFKKLNKRSTKKTHRYFSDLKPGTWRYAVTALDREGQESEMSDVLEVKISH